MSFFLKHKGFTLSALAIAAVPVVLLYLTKRKREKLAIEDEKRFLELASEFHLQGLFVDAILCLDHILEEVNPNSFAALRYKLLLEPRNDQRNKCLERMKKAASSDYEKQEAQAFEIIFSTPAEALSLLESVATQSNNYDLLIHIITARLLSNINIPKVRSDCDTILASPSASPLLLSKVTRIINFC